MCRFLSAIVTQHKKRVHWHPQTDHHSDLLEWMAETGRGDFRSDDAPNGKQKFARVEFVPTSDDWADIDAYQLNLDEQRTPDWWTQSVAADVEAELREAVEGMIVKDERALLLGDCWIIGVTGKVKRVAAGARVVFCTGSISRVGDNATVSRVGGNATVNRVWGNATVSDVWDNATVSGVGDNATVSRVGDNATVSDVVGNATVSRVWGNATVSGVGDNATVSDVGDNATVSDVGGNATVSGVVGNATVSGVWDNATVSGVGDNAKIENDHRKNKS